MRWPVLMLTGVRSAQTKEGGSNQSFPFHSCVLALLCHSISKLHPRAPQRARTPFDPTTMSDIRSFFGGGGTAKTPKSAGTKRKVRGPTTPTHALTATWAAGGNHHSTRLTY